jgi:predicted S18 family serine protease
MRDDEVLERLAKAENERDWYKDKLHEVAETLTNAKNALVSAGQTAINAIETIQALQERANNAEPILALANELVKCAEDNDQEAGAAIGSALAAAVIIWRKTLPS